MNNFEIVSEQNGGSDTFYISDDDDNNNDNNEQDHECIQKRRSYVLGVINENMYNILSDNINLLCNGTGGIRSGCIKLKVYKPGESIEFDNELLTTEDHRYPDKTICYSVEFTPDVIESNTLDINTYRVFGIDMIWCRKNILTERIGQFLN